MERGWESLSPWLPILPLTLLRQDFDGRFLSVTSHVETWTQIPPEEWVENMDFWETVHEADRDKVREHFEQTRLGVEVQSLEYRLRLPGTRRVVWVSERRRVALNRVGPASFEASWTDVTSRRMAERRMISSSWQRTLASMTPGVAHDLNNYFASILALSDNFVRKTPPDHPFSDGFRTIRDSVQQSARLLQRLVSVHMGRSGDRRYHHLDELLQEVVDFLRHTISRRIGFHLEFAPGRLPVYLDAVEFRRAFMALVKNAVDAIPNPGSGSIRFSSRWTAEPPTDVLDPLPPHAPGYVAISMADTGCGVPVADQKHLFHPWFSTKPPSEGTGLALHGVRQFAIQSGGSVAYEPAPDGGSCFTLWLPVSDLTEADRTSQSRTVVVYVDGSPAEVEDISQELKSWGLRVVGVNGTLADSLQDEDVGPDAVILLGQPLPSVLYGVSRLIRQRRWSTKIIGERPAEDPFASPSSADGVKPDLTLSAPLIGAGNLARLRSFLLSPTG